MHAMAWAGSRPSGLEALVVVVSCGEVLEEDTRGLSELLSIFLLVHKSVYCGYGILMNLL